jgi:hypothetical protein
MILKLHAGIDLFDIFGEQTLIFRFTMIEWCLFIW